MKIFEFHFNPNAGQGRRLKSVVYEPKSQREKRLGTFWGVGELVNPLAKNANLIAETALTAKTEYYSSQNLARAQKAGKKDTAETAFKGGLKKANAFLIKESKKGNTDWLGNLHLALCALVPRSEDRQYFIASTTGSVRLLLARRGRIVDIEEAGPKVYLRRFGNIVAGEVVTGDKVLIITENLWRRLEERKLLSDIGFAVTEKQLKTLFDAKTKELGETSGILFVLLIERLVREKQRRSLPKPSLPVLSLANLPRPSARLPLSLPIPRLPSIPALPVPKNLALVLLLLFVLGAGALAVQSTGRGTAESALHKAEELRETGQTALEAGEATKANAMFQEAWLLLSPFENSSKEVKEALHGLKAALAPLNNITFVKEPVLVAALEHEAGVLLASQGLVYAFSPNNLSVISSDGSVVKTSPPAPLAAGTILDSTPVFFSPPNSLLFYEQGSFQERSLQLPFAESVFSQLAAFRGGLYAYDKTTGELVKYASPAPTTSTPAVGTLWLASQNQRKPAPVEGGQSIAIDGAVWVASKDGLDKYSQGRYEETLKPGLFPPLGGVTGIAASSELPYLYLLDASENRVAVLRPSGEGVAQYVFEDADGLAAMAVSPDGRTVFLLSGTKVYSSPILTQP